MKNILTICLATILIISADDAFAAKRAKVRRQNDPQKELKDKLNNYFTDLPDRSHALQPIYRV